MIFLAHYFVEIVFALDLSSSILELSPSDDMKSRGGLAVAIALVSHEVTLTFAQYATTVTQYVNTNPFCTLVSGIGAPGLNGGGAGGAGFGPGSGYFNVSGNGTSSATNAT